MTDISKEQVEQIAALAVVRAFERLGIDGKNHNETQRDMIYLRDARRRHESVVNRISSWLLGGFILGGAVTAWKDTLASIFNAGGQ